MTDPTDGLTAAYEAAAEALEEIGSIAPNWMPVAVAQVAVNAALPLIRAVIADEIKSANYDDDDLVEGAVMYDHILRIVQWEQP